MGIVDKLKFWKDDDQQESNKLPPRESKREKSETSREVCKHCGKKDDKDNLRKYTGVYYHKKCLRKAKRDAKRKLR